MTFHYDADVDQLSIQLAARPYAESAEVAPGFILDFDAEGRVIGLEIEHASEHIDLTRLDASSLPVAEVILRKSPLAA